MLASINERCFGDLILSTTHVSRSLFLYLMKNSTHSEDEVCVDVGQGRELDQHQRLDRQVQVAFVEVLHEDVPEEIRLFLYPIVDLLAGTQGSGNVGLKMAFLRSRLCKICHFLSIYMLK